MQHVFRLILAAGVILTATSGTRAQQFSTRNVFTFAPAPAPSDLATVPRDDVDKKLNARAELKVRPNSGTELYLWVLNPNEDKDDFTVELKGAKGSLAARTKVTIPGNTWARVRLPKPAAPLPVVAVPAVPVVGTPATPVAAPEPPPPGIELTSDATDPTLTFRLLDKNGAELKDDAGKPYGRAFPVKLLAPSDYLETPVGTVTPGKTLTSVRFDVKERMPFHLPGTATIQLQFPPQPALKNAFIRDGFYRRNLTFSAVPDVIPSVTLTGSIENAGENVRTYVGADGIDRAFVYTLNPLGKTPGTQLTQTTGPAVRIALAAGALGKTVTQPVGTFPVLIEVDNPAVDDTLELRLRPAGLGNDVLDVLKVGPTRDVRVWLDVAGPTDGGLLFTTRSRDWIKPIDLASLRGKVEIVAVLKTQKGLITSEPPLRLTVDATPPEPIAFLPIPKEVEKGKPLSIAASVFDPETDVVKATFFLFKQLDDGKIPAEAIKATGTQSEKDPKVWRAELKIPADFRGDALVAVVFANQAGLVNDPAKVQEIKIIDARPPAGTIEGKVEFGGRPQPGVAVSLRDGDGKEKAATATDDKGKFKFEKVAPGNYVLLGAKKDSSTGASGTAPVQVEADKTAKAIVNLSKNR